MGFVDWKFGLDLERLHQGQTCKALPHLRLRGVKKERVSPILGQIVHETLENLERNLISEVFL